MSGVYLTPIGGPAAWRGSDISLDEGLRVLTPAEVDEIDAAVQHLHAVGEVDFPGITPETFPLPTLGRYFAGVADELRFGRGFLLLRGLPRECWPLDDWARIYYGLGAHIARPAPQSYLGELLGHVIDVSDVEAEARGYHAGGAQRMHTDNCDIVSLACVRAANRAASAALSAPPRCTTACSKSAPTSSPRSTAITCSAAWSATPSTAMVR